MSKYLTKKESFFDAYLMHQKKYLFDASKKKYFVNPVYSMSFSFSLFFKVVLFVLLVK